MTTTTVIVTTDKGEVEVERTTFRKKKLDEDLQHKAEQAQRELKLLQKLDIY